jgi:hypothetical protein
MVDHQEGGSRNQSGDGGEQGPQLAPPQYAATSRPHQPSGPWRPAVASGAASSGITTSSSWSSLRRWEHGPAHCEAPPAVRVSAPLLQPPVTPSFSHGAVLLRTSSSASSSMETIARHARWLLWQRRPPFPSGGSMSHAAAHPACGVGWLAAARADGG